MEATFGSCLVFPWLKANLYKGFPNGKVTTFSEKRSSHTNISQQSSQILVLFFCIIIFSFKAFVPVFDRSPKPLMEK